LPVSQRRIETTKRAMVSFCFALRGSTLMSRLGILFTSVGKTTKRVTQMTRIIMMDMGRPKNIHPRNVMSWPIKSLRKPAAMAHVVVPTRVDRPPAVAEYAMPRTMIFEKLPLLSSISLVILRAMVSIRAVEAVLLIHMDKKAVVAMMANMTNLASAFSLDKIW